MLLTWSGKRTALALATFAALAAHALTIAPTFLIPTWTNHGMGLAQAGGLASAPALGMVFALVPWGWVIDRCGERIPCVFGFIVAASAYAVASSVAEYRQLWLFLCLGGAGAASVNTATGRLVAGYFPSSQRGKAMGIRQTAQPLGNALAAVLLPMLAESVGAGRALLAPAFICGCVGGLCLLLLRDPVHQLPEQRTVPLMNPYRDGSKYLLRIHLSGMLLTVPQAIVWTFMFAWLRSDQGWKTVNAGLLVAAAQLLSALGRMVVGHWSDKTGSRTIPIRQMAVSVAVCLIILATADTVGLKLAVPCIVALAILSVADNGLTVTAVVEYAGTGYSGRALGVQSMGHLLVGSLAGPLFGAVIAAAGYPTLFGAAALAPIAAIFAIPSLPANRPGGIKRAIVRRQLPQQESVRDAAGRGRT
ncbi:MFS transporter [Mycobacterium simiae]|uniref:MFS transporter n=1 Tax=Mycobacterium simiae TaxID=1784 RepID=A0A5B1BR69_MYCSI|nr:MFS transporter [Mycobacterium simiae]KAA1251308.1 MFS transporter [Mycobacterium simiae]